MDRRRSLWRYRHPLPLVAAVTLVLMSSPVCTAEQPDTVDLAIVAEAEVLSEDDVEQRDITGTDQGRIVLDRADSAGDISTKTGVFRVFKFASQILIVPAETRVEVLRGRNAHGDIVYSTAPIAMPADIAAAPGLAVPPTSAWAYNNDGSGSETVGTWKRTWFWTMTKANDY